MTPCGVRSGEDALAELHRHPIALVVLDIGLPGIDGFEVCRRIAGSVPVIMLTARDEETDRVAGLGGRRRRLRRQAVLAAASSPRVSRRCCAGPADRGRPPAGDGADVIALGPVDAGPRGPARSTSTAPRSS